MFNFYVKLLGTHFQCRLLFGRSCPQKVNLRESCCYKKCKKFHTSWFNYIFNHNSIPCTQNSSSYQSASTILHVPGILCFMCIAFFFLSHFGTSNRNHLIINCLIMAIRIFKHKYTLYSSHLMIKPCDTFQLMIQCNPVYNCTVPASHLPYRGRTEASLDFILVKSFFRPPVT